MARLAARLDPAPDRQVLVYAKALIAWGSGKPTEERARELALALQRPGQGANWTALKVMVEVGADAAAAVDPTRLARRARGERANYRLMTAGSLLALRDGSDGLDSLACARA